MASPGPSAARPGDAEEPLALATVMLGTAGHIDHGKSTLVRHLTGVDPDRLPQEKDRELTIDLGFAPLVLSDGRTVGVIDVPGHERFIKNMVAGATSVDIALLVVDANDGVMPQTREHLEILELLGVGRMLVALTKIDTAGDELAELSAETVREELARTPFADAPIFPVSAVTGQGIDRLLVGIRAAVKATRPRSAAGAFRMPIQRVFSARGLGTVVTGVPVAGRVAPGDTIEVAPLGALGRVRRIQAYHHEAAEARAGHSAALNVADLDYKDLHRGMVAMTPGAFRASALVEANLRHLASSPRPLAHLEEVRVHVGTAEVLGQLALLEGRTLAPGESATVQLRLREEVVAAPGDRFILRRHAEPRTVAGGEVLGLSDHRYKAGKAFVLEALSRKREALGDPAALVEEALRLAGTAPQSTDALAVKAGIDAAAAQRILQGLAAAGRVHALGRGPRWVHQDGAAAAEGRVVAAVQALYEAEPLRVHVERLQVRELTRLDPELFERALDGLVEARRLDRLDAHRLAQRGRQVTLTPAEEARRAAVLRAFQADPRRPPEEGQLVALLEIARGGAKEVRMLLGVLCEEGLLVHIGAGVHFLVEAYAEARAVLEALGQGGAEVTASAFREQAGLTRKYAIPLLEHFDREGLTERRGPNRVLRAP